MYCDLEKLKVFEGPSEHKVMVMDDQLGRVKFSVKVDREQKTLSVIHLSDMAQSKGPIATLSSEGLVSSEAYPKELIDKVFSTIRTGLIITDAHMHDH